MEDPSESKLRSSLSWLTDEEMKESNISADTIRKASGASGFETKEAGEGMIVTREGKHPSMRLSPGIH
ncbi:MAG: hypothetical protein IKG00_00045 [Lachnospiraceae bacterium]|nr:hypothetical protein [Lachnospiraceae bacterium]